ncbi:hypothetical protein SAMN05444851_0765 [Aliiroseovarius sediminilitoris]|uniref:Uncharacterized protein n=1 Tax=Aliiroseovarius sediminilitoris TaxID=1173584 RepID=A0A1I0NEN8_9RHOB|nr:hypothetical protein [Aliiroseovarius sediminilitoris]SEV99691.1 hypothetical protein SAMN05444851_0765 [Aliiroseovarius sediminilitoris]
MIRVVFAYGLALALTVASFSLAYARGGSPDMDKAIELVICTGVGMVTMTIGPDGEPVESIYLCPDGAQMFAAAFAFPVVHMPEARLINRITPMNSASFLGRPSLTPSARGPPALI